MYTSIRGHPVPCLCHGRGPEIQDSRADGGRQIDGGRIGQERVNASIHHVHQGGRHINRRSLSHENGCQLGGRGHEGGGRQDGTIADFIRGANGKGIGLQRLQVFKAVGTLGGDHGGLGDSV